MREDLDLSKYDLNRIRTWAENIRKAKQADTPLYRKLLERQAELSGKGLKVDQSIAHLMEAARSGKFTTYGNLAAASEIPWSQARYAMNGAGGHLDQLLDICHARGLPMLTSICVNQQNTERGELGPDALAGFIGGVRRLGIEVLESDAKAFLHEKQQECFRWGQSAGGA